VSVDPQKLARAIFNTRWDKVELSSETKPTYPQSSLALFFGHACLRVSTYSEWSLKAKHRAMTLLAIAAFGKQSKMRKDSHAEHRTLRCAGRKSRARLHRCKSFIRGSHCCGRPNNLTLTFFTFVALCPDRP